MAVDARADPQSARGPIKRVADQLGVPRTWRNWVWQAEIDDGVRPGTTSDDAQRLADLEREVRQLRPGERGPEYVRGLFSRHCHAGGVRSGPLASSLLRRPRRWLLVRCAARPDALPWGVTWLDRSLPGLD